ncbi:MAG TPA: DUF2917 domain-containing protein [Burkholderiaceae bacterium]|nr:DUF2917 domain-containing protein [Burkholderiaceae bacterium]
MNHGVYYELQAGELLRLPRLNQPLRIMQGRVWVTAARQLEDRVLDAGHDWLPGDAREVVIEALCTARVLIVGPQTAGARMHAAQTWMRFANAFALPVRRLAGATGALARRLSLS